MDPQPRKVGVVGLGLIGGSIGLDLQSQGWHVQGLVHRRPRRSGRWSQGDEAAGPCLPRHCELVILALPILPLEPDPSLVAALPASAVVTDVGSVKQPVLDVWSMLHPRFVASHPMAGTAEAGVEAGLHGLFRGRPWIATPNLSTQSDALDQIEHLATSLGSQWLTAEAAQHDQAVALISHLPVLVSAALLRAVGEERDPAIRQLAMRLASSGFADTSRVGGGNPALGVAMASTNRDAVLRGLAAYRWSLEQLEDAVLNRNRQQLEQELERTQSLRPALD